MAIDVNDKLVTVGALSVAYNALKDVLDRIGASATNSNPSMLVNLSSQSADNVMKAAPRPGVTGTLPIPNGGTGGTTAAKAKENLGLGTEAMNFSVSQPASTNESADQAFLIRANVQNSQYDRDGHELILYPSETGLGLYDRTSGEPVWKIAATGNFDGSNIEGQLALIRWTVDNESEEELNGTQVILVPQEDGIGVWSSYKAAQGSNGWLFNIKVPISIENGGTGAENAAKARANLGFGTEEMNFRVTNPTDEHQAFLICSKVANGNYTARNTHEVRLYPTEYGLRFYDNTDEEMIWRIPGNPIPENGIYTFQTIAANGTNEAKIWLDEQQTSSNYFVITETATGAVTVGVHDKESGSFMLSVRNVTGSALSDIAVKWAIVKVPEVL